MIIYVLDEKAINPMEINDNIALHLFSFQVLLLSFSLILFPRFQPLAPSRTGDPADHITDKGACFSELKVWKASATVCITVLGNPSHGEGTIYNSENYFPELKYAFFPPSTSRKAKSGGITFKDSFPPEVQKHSRFLGPDIWLETDLSMFHVSTVTWSKRGIHRVRKLHIASKV